MSGTPTQRQPTPDAWVEKHKLVPSGSHIEKAHRAIDLVLSDQSELVELWQESDELEEWQAGVIDLKSRVRA